MVDDHVEPEPYTDEMAAFVERFAADLTEAGMQRMAARLFSCMLVSNESALSSAELAHRLQVSPAAISGAVRYLSQVHMITRERQPGSRRERYRLRHEVWYEAMANRDVILKRWQATMNDGVGIVGPESPAGRRMAETAEFMAFLEREVQAMLERWRGRGSSGRRGPDGG